MKQIREKISSLDKTKEKVDKMAETYAYKLGELENKMSDLQNVLNHITKRIDTNNDHRTLSDILTDFDTLKRDTTDRFDKINHQAIQRYEKLNKEIQVNREK